MPKSLGKKDISVATRLRVVLFLAESSVCGMVLRGAVCAAVSEFNLSRNSIKKVWCIRGKVDVISAPARCSQSVEGACMSVAVATDAVTSGYRQLYA
ncbi:hypothetical protein PC116_g10012 [Phytophthora cactorum]|nr:hypothetical protein PC116_g10012 [Phytophthora cactorum]